MPPGDSSYSEQESALILQRAAELQAQQGRSLSLGELESAAAEAGIDVALVRRAADEVTAMVVSPPSAPPAVAASRGTLGAPLHVVHERMVEGELDASGWDDVLAEIRRHLGVSGHQESVGRQLTWTLAHGRNVHVSLTPRSGRTLIRVEERLGELGGGLFLGMGLPLTLAGLGFIIPICLVADMAVLIPVALAAWAGLVFGFARVLFTTIVRQRDPQLRALADGLADVCRKP